MLLKRKKSKKNPVNFKIWKFSFSVHFSKMSSRRLANLITIYRIPGFLFSSPSSFNAIHSFNMRFHVSQKRIAIILLPIFVKLQFVVSIKFTGYHILLLELISFQKLQPPKTPTTAERQLQLKLANSNLLNSNFRITRVFLSVPTFFLQVLLHSFVQKWLG